MNEKTSNNSEESPIALESLLEFCRGRKDFAQKLLWSFVQSKDGYLADLESAILAENAPEIRATCHKLIGASSTVKAEKLHALILDIRQNVVAGNVQLAKSKTHLVKEAFEEIAEFTATALSPE